MSVPAVVVVTPEASAQPRSGGSIRIMRLLDALAPHVDLTVVCVGDAVDAGAVSKRLGGAEVRWFASRRAPGNRVTALAHAEPIAFARLANAHAVGEVRRLQAHGATTIVDHLRTVPFRPHAGRYIVSLHNAESRWLAGLPPADSRWRRLEHRWDVVATRRAERRLAADPEAAIVVVSDDDRQTLGVPRAVVVPNGVDLPASVPPLPAAGPPIFVGALDYAPNVEALRWWCAQVWPLMDGRCPPLRVVGRGGAAALGALATQPALDLVGEVDDVGPELASASLAVLPLRSGGGSRLKVLEAMAHGRPVVATPIAIAGFPVEADRDALVADAPADFAHAVLRVLHDGGTARALAERGRLFAAGYTWDRISPGFVELVCSNAAGH